MPEADTPPPATSAAPPSTKSAAAAPPPPPDETFERPDVLDVGDGVAPPLLLGGSAATRPRRPRDRRGPRLLIVFGAHVERAAVEVPETTVHLEVRAPRSYQGGSWNSRAVCVPCSRRARR